MAKIPAKIGKYEITNKIAEGGMGAVYKGVHPTLNKEVILKKLTLSGDEHINERFKREARIMMDFKNDNIVDVYDHFKAGGSYYIVLEYVDGIALDQLLKKERYLPNDTALLIFLEACKALKYAHDKNVVHRDIKPGNILLSKTGEIKLVDFGIASITDDDETNLTRDGMTLGTPSYMAPEQFNNSKSVDIRADIYSMGVMLYEMVTGKKPYPGNYSPETLAKIQKGKYLSPKKHNPSISPLIGKIISKCMKSKADRRYKDLGKIISTLEKYFRKKNRQNARNILIAKITGEKIEIPPLKRPVFRRLAAVLLALILLGGAGYVLYRSGYYHEILNSSEFGALRVQVKVPKAGKDPEDIYLKAYLFVDDDNEIPSIEYKIRFARKEESDSFYIFESNTIYQPAGNYRIKIKCESELFWGSFGINSVRDSALLTGGSKTNLISFTAGSPRPVPMSLRTRVFDYSTGRDISETVQTLINEGGKWIELSKLKEPMISGKVYKIRFTAEQYGPKEFSMRVDTYQSVLDLTVNLVPDSGNITISSVETGFKVDIAGEAASWIDKTVSLTEDGEAISLYPGDYSLTFKGKGIEKTVSVTVTGTTELSLTVLFNKDEKNITIEGLSDENNR
ncbi:serine/threonine-protein kinase [Spirochaeta isovalerica]|uniref:non-specific serine/threonine protein kinase n=1 Tax=Spirochaeta isovalerica TaxID=150 RepID=A0A841R5K1_9SPIO|nr:serine/threonine-protein kinase [Spirochaeta isovalerica]MBB6479135.1 serine/threonine-protein kinase [Spirochaeta isovalerica]